ncbi:MAG TPA: tetratricopeptide repeat protein [Burkholderiales bacterium]|nr:tetratricopeptide repeat protein [Burkholderiales bacterium]
MSLINQVLQDLEKRHAADPELTSLPPQVRAVRAGSLPAIRLLAIALILALAAVGVFVYVSGMLPPAATTPLTTTPISAKKQTSATAPMAQATVRAPTPVPMEPAVQAVLLPPVSRLSEELSFNPEPGAPAVRAAAPKVRAPKPRTEKSVPAFPAPAPPAVAPPVTPDPPVTAATPDSATATATATQPQSAQRPSGIDKQMREMTVQQRAETAFRIGVAQLQDGRVSTAEKSFREALKEDPMHVGARQALLGLLLDGGRNDEAEQLLRHALELNPRQPRHAMVLARLEVERGEIGGAINTLVGALPYVRSDPEYFAFLAALLQRDGRHRDAVNYYRTALQSSPGNALWLMGAGISLRANDQFADAREAFQHAADSKQLNAELQAFVERQLRELSAKK